MNRPVRLHIEASLQHLPPQVFANLEQTIGVIVDPNEYGAWLMVPAAVNERIEKYPEIPVELAQLWRLARELRCDWVRLDADAAIVDGLPTFDWSRPESLDHLSIAHIPGFGEMDAPTRASVARGRWTWFARRVEISVEDWTAVDDHSQICARFTFGNAPYELLCEQSGAMRARRIHRTPGAH